MRSWRAPGLLHDGRNEGSRIRRHYRAACDRLRLLAKTRIDPAPVPAAGIARVAGEQSVLNFVAWHCNPAPVDQHLQADRRYSERRGRTVGLVAARRSFAIRKMRVDVVGGGRAAFRYTQPEVV